MNLQIVGLGAFGGLSKWSAYSPTLPSVHWFKIECPDFFLDAVLEFLLAV